MTSPCAPDGAPGPLLTRAVDLLARQAAFGVVLGTRSGGAPVTLDGSARLVWDVLAVPTRRADVVAEVARRCDVEPDAIRSSVESTLDELLVLDIVTSAP